MILRISSKCNAKFQSDKMKGRSIRIIRAYRGRRLPLAEPICFAQFKHRVVSSSEIRPALEKPLLAPMVAIFLTGMNNLYFRRGEHLSPWLEIAYIAEDSSYRHVYIIRWLPPTFPGLHYQITLQWPPNKHRPKLLLRLNPPTKTAGVPISSATDSTLTCAPLRDWTCS